MRYAGKRGSEESALTPGGVRETKVVEGKWKALAMRGICREVQLSEHSHHVG